MKQIIWACLLLAGLNACTVSRYSNKSKNDETQVKVMEDETYLASSQGTQPLARGVKSRGVITVAMLAQVAGMGAKAVKKVIDNEKAKYTATYEDGLYGLYFYNRLSDKNVWDPEGIQFKGFTFVRTFKNKQGKTDTALKATFVLDTSRAFEMYNNAVFRLKLKELVINYAKAKVPTQRWYFPWSYLQKDKNDKLDLDIEITFNTTYNTEQGLIHPDITLGRFYLFVRDAPLNKNDSNYKRYYQDLAGEQLDGQCFIVPRSFGHYFNGSEFKPCYSQGNYNIYIQVTESGQDKYVDKLIMDNSGIAVDALAEQIQKIK